MTVFEANEELFSSNFDLLNAKDSLIAHQALFAPFTTLSFCRNDKGELNLLKKDGTYTFYLHSKQDIEQEMNHLLKDEQLEEVDYIYFYGLGLGYIYPPLKAWLHKKPSRHLILIEDDLEVIKAFLYSPLAKEILQDAQVTFYRPLFDEQESSRLRNLCIRFVGSTPRVLASPFYTMIKKKHTVELCASILSFTTLEYMIGEVASGGRNFFNNYYSNLLEKLPGSYEIKNLIGRFKNRPAIICGAGPSLEKNIDLLKTLGDRALILAGGSSLNVLNGHQVWPHFGAGIDPNPEQFHRLLTNDSFHLPFFYRSRIAHEALSLVQGPRIYVAGNPFYPISDWVDDQLNIQLNQDEPGLNVVNWCTDLAIQLGCNPIIFVGLDLAFTDIKNYAQGIPYHPLWLDQRNPYQLEAKQEVVLVKDIEGRSIKTKWLWLEEANWYSDYVAKYPNHTFINATEGGIGIPSVSNQTLKKVIQEFQTPPADLLNDIHSSIQEGSLQVEGSTIICLFQAIKAELEKCQNLCFFILKEFDKKIRTVSSEEIVQPLFNPYTTEAILAEYELESSWIYHFFLKNFDWIYKLIKTPQDFASPVQFNVNSYLLSSPDFYRFELLGSFITNNLSFLQKAVWDYIQSVSSFKQHHFSLAPDLTQPPYVFKEGLLTIQDSELGLNINEKVDAQNIEKHTENHLNGALYKEWYSYQGALHGPSCFYSKEGRLLAQGWFVKGQREGRNLQFYLSGHLFGVQRFVHNQLEGKQEYYYENGIPHVILSYRQGRLDGVVSIYNPEGQMIREIHYKNGLRDGLEKMWWPNQRLHMECNYEEGIPTGIARQWDERGNLRKEVIVHQFPDSFDMQIWNSEGQVIKRFVEGIEDFQSYYEEQQKKVNFMEGALRAITKRLEQVVGGEEFTDIETKELFSMEIARLQAEIQQLTQAQQELLEKMHQNLEFAQKSRQKA